MARNNKNVRVALKVIASIVPSGTAVTSTDPVVGQIDLGHITQGGVVFTQGVEKVEVPMHGVAVTRTVKKAEKGEWKLELGETKNETLRVAGLLDENLRPARTIIESIRLDALDIDEATGEFYVFQTTWIDDAEVELSGDVSWIEDQAVVYPLLVTGHPKDYGVAKVFHGNPPASA